MKKKKYMVVARSKKAALDGLDTSRGHRDFTQNSVMYVSDTSEAKEIDQKYGKSGTMDAYVVEDHQYERALNGESWDVKGNNVKVLHSYHFGSSQSYADAWEAFERRRNLKKRRMAAEEAEVEDGETDVPKEKEDVEEGVCDPVQEEQGEPGGEGSLPNPRQGSRKKRTR